SPLLPLSPSIAIHNLYEQQLTTLIYQYLIDSSTADLSGRVRRYQKFLNLTNTSLATHRTILEEISAIFG
ncbi:hypothetical protein, partial [Tychonema sp. LEGE 06208]|uniref:hypothetical protein n=1 Tax=Tychonema sp. LEGE 06208 TaxID=1828663 RepID=UPI001D15589B